MEKCAYCGYETDGVVSLEHSEQECEAMQGAGEQRTYPAHYDSPDNNAWTRANYGLPPEPGDPGYGED